MQAVVGSLSEARPGDNHVLSPQVVLIHSCSGGKTAFHFYEGKGKRLIQDLTLPDGTEAKMASPQGILSP